MLFYRKTAPVVLCGDGHDYDDVLYTIKSCAQLVWDVLFPERAKDAYQITPIAMTLCHEVSGKLGYLNLCSV